MLKLAVAGTVFTLIVAAGSAFAGEGNGNPFPPPANATVAQGPAFMVDTGSEAFPSASGNRVQSSTLSQLAPAPGTERILQTIIEAGVAHPVG